MIQILILIWCFALPYNNHIPSDQNIILTGEVAFVSDAPLEYITAKSTSLQGVISKDQGTFAFQVGIKSFNGFNSALQQEHFNENYMESNTFAKSTYTGKILDPIPWDKDGTYQIRTKGTFNIHGIKRERIIKNKVTISKGTITIESDFEVLLNEHNIRIPKIVENKISPIIKVQLRVKGSI